MTMELQPFFDRYEALVRTVDQVFEQMKARYPECVRCREGCADCCYALFDLSLIEALYISRQFRERFQGEEREALLEAANRADRQTYKLKHRAYRDLEAGRGEQEIIAEMTTERVRCPLLDAQDRCLLYDRRPITCRFYGIPTAIGGAGRTCGLSGFEKGQSYPTVNLEAIHRQLYRISADLAAHIQSRFKQLDEILVPLSMALLTEYDEAQLGVTVPGDGAAPQRDGEV